MRSETILKCLRTYESRNVTFQDPDGSWPVVWKRASGCRVWDEEDRPYLDLTAAFGVANAGHANAQVVRAGQEQMGRLLHAMGDVHPHRLKAELARELSRLTFGRWKPRGRGKTIFCSSGFEAVEAALKTALLATGRPGIIAFEGGYHGLGYGALNATHRGHFRDPFRRQLRDFASFLPFPCDPGVRCEGGRDVPSAQPARTLRNLERQLRRRVREGGIGAILVEPVQARGGIRIPPAGFLAMLRQVATETGVLLILDEVYTGFGRTGRWFATEHEGVAPDLICVGKALTGGFPLSACIGEAGIMDRSWPEASGEAIHTSTFLGHPVGCAMALAQIGEIRRRGLVQRSARLGRRLLKRLKAVRLREPGLWCEARGVGLMAGLQLHRSDGRPATAESLSAVKAMLHRGFILLPEGAEADVIGFTPPLVIGERDLDRAVDALQRCLQLDPK